MLQKHLVVHSHLREKDRESVLSKKEMLEGQARSKLKWLLK
jgi:hypothetical protein